MCIIYRNFKFGFSNLLEPSSDCEPCPQISKSIAASNRIIIRASPQLQSHANVPQGLLCDQLVLHTLGIALGGNTLAGVSHQLQSQCYAPWVFAVVDIVGHHNHWITLNCDLHYNQNDHNAKSMGSQQV